MLANLSRTGTLAFDQVLAETSDGEARIVTRGAHEGVDVETSYVLDAADPTRLLIRTRAERSAEGERLFAITDVAVHNEGTLRPFVLARHGHSEGFHHASTGNASISELMNAIVPLESVTLVGPGGGALPISYTLRILGARHIATDGSESEVATFGLSTETLTMMATFVEPYLLGSIETTNLFKLAQSLLMDLDVGEALVFEREIRVEARIDGREAADSARADGARVTGRVDTPLARIHAFDEGGSATGFASPEPDGSFALRLPPGEHELRVVAEGGREARVPVAVPESTQDEDEAALVGAAIDVGSVPLPPRATVRFSEDLGPVRLSFRGRGDTPDPVFGDDLTGFRSGGEPVPAHLSSSNVYLGGFGTDPALVAIAPGAYRVYATRGPEFDVTFADFEIAAGEEHALELEPPLRIAETPGWISSDLHVHAAPSDDSTVPMHMRVASFLAEGGEVLVSTDHDHVSDYGPLIDALGLRDRIRSVVGLEVTGVVKTPIVPFSVGHSNVFPMPYRPDLHRKGALRSENVRLRDIVAEARGLPGRRLVQLNHARPHSSEGGAAAEGGAFLDHLSIGTAFDPGRVLDSEPNRSLLDADPESGVRDVDFDAMELLNGASMERYERLRADWISLLRQGQRKTATGNSDTHSLYRVPAVPRNYVQMSDDTPRAFEEAPFIDAVGRGALWVTTGPLLDVSLDDAVPGSTFTGTDGTLRIAVRAASWVPVSQVRIRVDGEVVQSRTLTAPADIQIPLGFERDSFVSVEVEGPAEGVYAELLPKFTPFAFTNAIYVDADGDGNWTPPGL